MIEVGQYFGKYRLIERLATGGMAEIFKAGVQAADGSERIVVIKRLHRSMSEDMELTKMLVDEARISVLLDHPNIGQVFDLGVIQNQYYIVMAFIDGMDALQILDAMKLRREFLPIPAAIHIISEVCAALQYAHTLAGPDGRPLGIVHRDVSPQNIMVSFDGQVRLVDFGIAKARMRAQTTQAGVIKGKFYYMSPEQAHGNHVDGRSDVFSAAMVLYEMLAAQSPYNDVSDAELLRAVRMANFPPLSAYRRDIDPRLEQIVMTALQRDPNLRFPSAEAFRHALEEYARFTYPPVNHREQMSHFVNNVAGRRAPEPAPRMDRRQFLASDESMIFARPGAGLVNFQQQAPALHPPMEFEFTRGDLPSHRDMMPVPGLAGGFASLPVSPNPAPHVSPGPAQQLGPLLPMMPAPKPDQRPFETAEASRADVGVSATNVARAISSPKFIIGAVVAVLILSVVAWILASGSKTEPAPEVAAVAQAPAEAGPTIASIAMNTIPANAMVKVDGEERGSTPVLIELETGKTYQIEFVRHGFKTHSQELEVKGAVQPLEVILEEQLGVMKIASFPSNAVVRVDNREVGNTPYNHTGLVPDKKYLIEVNLNGKKLDREVEWKKGESSVIDVLFEFEKGLAPPIIAAVTEEAQGELRRPPAVTSTPTTTKKTTTTRKTATRKPKASEEDDENLSVWGTSKKTTTKPKEDEEEAESISVWGSSKKKTTKKTEEPAEEKTEKLKLW